MKNAFVIRLLMLTFTVCAVTSIAYALQNKHREFNVTKEKELRVVLDVSFGSIYIERGDRDIAASVDYEEDETDKHKLNISYDVTGDLGTLRIKLKKSAHFWGNDDHHNDDHRHLYLKFSDAIPISFDVELGAGEGNIDLTDLQVQDIQISTGASSVTMKCDRPNPITAEDISIESGVSKFTAENLSNLNFRNLKFSGGVGSYKLDFSGTFRQSAETQIEIGLGSINIYVPKSIPTKIKYDDNWLSSFSIDDDFQKTHNGVYETEDFKNAGKRLTIKMSSGLGSVHVKRK